MCTWGGFGAKGIDFGKPVKGVFEEEEFIYRLLHNKVFASRGFIKKIKFCQNS